jgi:hypothetical protein
MRKVIESVVEFVIVVILVFSLLILFFYNINHNNSIQLEFQTDDTFGSKGLTDV